MDFQLPKKELLNIELRRCKKGVKVEGAYKDVIYEALSQKNVVRASTPFNTEKANYRVLSYEKHGDSVKVSILKLSK